MRILRSIHSANPAIGGPIEAVKQSSAVLLERGHQVEIVSLDSPADPWVAACPVPVHAMGPGRGGYGYAPRFTRWIAEHRAAYDTVIVHGIWQYSSFGVWRALRGSDTPYFVFPHGMLDPWFNRTYPLKHLKKLLYWPWGEYRVLRDAAAVLFTSEEERRLARQSFALYRCQEEVVNYGTAAPAVDLEAVRAEFIEAYPHLRGKRILLFLGRLHEKKGCELLIDAFASARGASTHPDQLHLVMAGPCRDEAYLGRLKHLAGEASGVTFTGMITGNLKWGAFKAADAFVLPSHQENFGIAVVEAMACGTPVLVSKEVNIWREIVADGAGFAEEDNAAGTARLLEQWLSLGEPEAGRMRLAARASFSKRFEIHRAVDSLVGVLERHGVGGRRTSALERVA